MESKASVVASLQADNASLKATVKELNARNENTDNYISRIQALESIISTLTNVAHKREVLERDLRLQIESAYEQQIQEGGSVSQSGLTALVTALSEKEDLIDMLNNECKTLVCDYVNNHPLIPCRTLALLTSRWRWPRRRRS